MATYERSVRVGAPLESVWAFHSTADGLEALTPDWLHLRVESVRGPDGKRDPAVLEAGTVLGLSVRPFGIGPRQRWVSEIAERERDDNSARFRDVMSEGPFDRWEHRHHFFADGDATILTDFVSYELPLGPVGTAADHLAVVGFEPMFRYRHRRTRALLE